MQVFNHALIGALAFGAVTVLSANDTCCTALSKAWPDLTFFPSNAGYENVQESYFSQLESGVSPRCIFKPGDTETVAAGVKILSQLGRDACKFAVKGGGHTPWAGSANIDEGVTIDMSSINDIGMTQGLAWLVVGAGATWGDVYAWVVDPSVSAHNWTVVGARASQVGVSGSILGGGLAFSSPRYGFACDNVQGMTLVTGSGEILAVSEDFHPDLFQALKGGANNLGIVTNFEINVQYMSDMWGGQITYDISLVPKALKAFHQLNGANPYDEFASTVQFISYTNDKGFFGGNTISYTKPESNPPAFKPYEAVQPRLSDTLRIANIKSLTDEHGRLSPKGKRWFYMTLTFKNDLPFLNHMYSLWNATVDQVFDIPGIGHTLIFEPLSPAITSKWSKAPDHRFINPYSKRLGNILGLDSLSEPLVLIHLSISWTNSGDDAHINNVARTLISDLDKAAIAAGVHHDFIYLPYAIKGQDPIAGYGIESVEELRAASNKYDPERVFQRQVPGGFKLLI